MSGLVFVTGGMFAAAGSAIDQYYGLWDPSTNLPVLADGDPYSDGSYFRCSTDGSIDLGSGTIDFDRDDEVYKFGGVWQLRDEAPLADKLIVNMIGELIVDASGELIYKA